MKNVMKCLTMYVAWLIFELAKLVCGKYGLDPIMNGQMYSCAHGCASWFCTYKPNICMELNGIILLREKMSF